MRWMIAPLLLAACAAAPAAPTPDAATLVQRAMVHVERQHDDLIALRRDIHRYPELSGEETRTAALVSARLEALGFEVRRDVGGHGVVGVLRGGRAGRVIAFRADMDAVRDGSPDPVDFRSERPGVRHICGHDIHTTIGMAIAEAFAAIRDDMPGTLVLLFQPAEEIAGGAQAMLDDGAMEAPRPDAVYGFHTAPFEVGEFVTSESVLMAIRDRATLSAAGANASEALGEIVETLSAANTAGPFSTQPVDGAWINVDAGAPAQRDGNRVTTNVVFNLSTEAARANARGAVDAAVERARAANPHTVIEARYEAAWVPGIQNNAAVTARAVQSIRAELGETAARYTTSVVPVFSEDFGHFQARAPGTFIFIGVSKSERGWVGMPHTPNYVADERAIFVGTRAMTRVILDAMTTAG